MPPASNMVLGDKVMCNVDISVILDIVSDLRLTGASTTVIGSGSILPIQYVACSLPITMFSVFKPPYVYGLWP